MNFLDLMDPQKRKMMELLEQQQAAQMMQGLTPEMLQQMQGMGVTPYAAQAMPQAGQPGYGVLAPAMTPEAMAQGQAAASGAPSMGQALPGLLSMAANLSGGAEEQQPPMPPPPPTRPVGTSKEGIAKPQAKREEEIRRRRRFRS